MRGEKLSAISNRVSCAVRSQSSSRARTVSLGSRARAWDSVMPGRIPAWRARRVAATVRAALPFPWKMAMASPRSSGSLRNRAANGNNGTREHARRGMTRLWGVGLPREPGRSL